MSKPIYLDYAATTPVDPRVAEVMARYLTQDGIFGNAASTGHVYGWEAEDAVRQARRDVANLLNCEPCEIIWTSGATESDNLALKGAFCASKDKKHIITTAFEHKAILDTCAYLENQGATVTYLKPDAQGIIHPEQVLQAITPETLIISVMHVNNETGAIQPIQAIAELAQKYGILFHVDAVQGVGKLPIDLKATPIDLLSVSAHKMYGPKGIGVLFARQCVQGKKHAQIHGGGQERGLRSGTLPTHQIAGMGLAAKIAQAEMADESARLAQLRDTLWAGIADLPGVVRHGDPVSTSPNILNVRFEGLSSELVLNALTDLAISSGSACNSASLAGSHVLKSMGLTEAQAQSSLRFSVGRMTTALEIERAIAHLREKITGLATQKDRLWAV